jgi:hypothetical protein
MVGGAFEDHVDGNIEGKGGMKERIDLDQQRFLEQAIGGFSVAIGAEDGQHKRERGPQRGVLRRASGRPPAPAI